MSNSKQKNNKDDRYNSEGNDENPNDTSMVVDERPKDSEEFPRTINLADENEEIFVNKIVCLPNNNSIFVCGTKELLKEININTGEIIKDYKSNYSAKYRTNFSDITTIEVTPNSKYLFAATNDSNLKQF